MDKNRFLAKQRLRRRHHVRKKVRGTPDRPRLCLFRSHKNLSCQVIDDATGRTLVAASTCEPELREKLAYGGNCDAAKLVGQVVGQRALQAGIQQVRFDRGHYKYHGRVAAVADGAREAGLSL